MKYADINRRFTEIAAEYMAAGYVLNTASMNGSGGEIANLDLTDGQEIIRLLVTRFHDWGDCCTNEGVDIIVGRAAKEDRAEPHADSGWQTIWNSHLEVLRQERFYQVGEDWGDGNFYGTQKEAEAAWAIRMRRYKAKREKECAAQ